VRRQTLTRDLDFGQFGHSCQCLSVGETANISQLLYVSLARAPAPR
jgi:hypothetical protein